MSSTPSPKRSIRIGGASGGFTDRVSAITRLASDPSINAIVGDWLSENVMTGYGAGKERRRRLEQERGSPFSFEEKMQAPNFASTFLQCFEPAIGELMRNGTRLVVNAGANDTQLLAEVVRNMAEERGWKARVAWVEGDEVTDLFKNSVNEGKEYRNSCSGRTLKEWSYEPICAQAYLGSLGIAEALRKGADVIICGRVSDAAPTIGLAVWWHEWRADQLNELAGALVAGHLIECSAFITGGYYSAFKDLMRQKKHLNLGFPIAEVESNGQCVITKEKVCSILDHYTDRFELMNIKEHRWRRECRNGHVTACLRDIRTTIPQLRRGRQPRRRTSHPIRSGSCACIRYNRPPSTADNPSRHHSARRIPSRMALLPRRPRHGRKGAVDGRASSPCHR
jgi:hypothetical protein